MIELYSPRDSSELVLIKSILDSEGIDYFVKNDNFGSMYIGPVIDLYNKKMILVQDSRHERARELLNDFLNKTDIVTEPAGKNYSLSDKIRLLFEFLFFGWIIPGNRKKNKSK